MILTCPECATRYSVADDSVGPEGRTVRCASCGLIWRTERDPALDLAAPEPPAPAEIGAALSADELPRAFRERIAAQTRGRKAARNGLFLGAAGAAAAALVLGLVLGREGVVEAWPKTASAYAAVGLPVNSVGLVIEDQAAEVGFYQGRPAAIVTGALRNVRSRPVAVPPMRFDLVDAHDQVLDSRVHRLAKVEIAPGATRTFAMRLVDPPEPTRDVDVTFLLKDAPANGEAAEDHAAEAPHRTAALRSAHRPASGSSEH